MQLLWSKVLLVFLTDKKLTKLLSSSVICRNNVFFPTTYEDLSVMLTWSSRARLRWAQYVSLIWVNLMEPKREEFLLKILVLMWNIWNLRENYSKKNPNRWNDFNYANSMFIVSRKNSFCIKLSNILLRFVGVI